MPSEEPAERKASLGYEKNLRDAANLLHSNKHGVLGLLFLKYSPNAFEDRRKEPSELLANLY